MGSENKTCWDGEGMVSLQDVLNVLHERVMADNHELLSSIAVDMHHIPVQIEGHSNAK